MEYNFCQPKIIADPVQGNVPFEPTGDKGTGFGVLLELEVSSTVSLMLRPMAIFSKFSAQYQDRWGNTYVERLDLQYVEFPLHAKVKFLEGPYQPFVSLGPNLAHTLDRADHFFFFWDVAAGCEVHIAKWTLVPELRYSIGTSDVKPAHNGQYRTDTEKVRANMLHLMLSVKF